MKTNRLFCVFGLFCSLGVNEAASAQSPPTLGFQFAAGYPTLVIVGEAGVVYTIQNTDDISGISPWIDRTLLQVQTSSNAWTDPSPPVASQRFYRAVSVPTPADTNLVFIQPGTFTMGSPTNEALRSADETEHIVTVSRGFWMGRHEVTQSEYQAVMGNNPSWFNGIFEYYDPGCQCTTNRDYGTDLTRPVEQVSWADATNYCSQLTQRDRAAGRIAINCVYRLPTEAEWEYACRAGTRTACYLGGGLQSGQANFNGQFEYDADLGNIENATGVYLQETAPVESYAPNGWGLYDTIGNVWEWCQDWYADYPTGPITDPQGPESGRFRVLRGGTWPSRAMFCRSAKRTSGNSDSRSYQIGFRVVLALAQP